MQVELARASVKEERTFRCAYCQHTADAEVTGFGEGSQSMLNGDGTAQRRAEEDAKKDIERAIADVRCPSCQRRPAGADLRFWRPWGLLYVGAWLLGVVAGMLPTWLDMNMREHDRHIAMWVLPLILGGTATFVVPLTLLGKLAVRDRRVRWLAAMRMGGGKR